MTRRIPFRCLYRGVSAAILLAFGLVAMPFAASAPGGPDAAVVLLDGSGIDWRTAREIIEIHGGEIRHIVPPHALVGTIPEGAIHALRETPPTTGENAAFGDSVRIVRSDPGARALMGDPELSQSERLGLAFLVPTPVRPPGEDGLYRQVGKDAWERLPPEAWEEPALTPEDELPGWEGDDRAVGNTFYYTSDFLAGDVAIGIVRPESNGTDGNNDEDWTAGEVTTTWNELIAATARLSGNAPQGKVTFVYRTEDFGAGVAGTVESDYEAVIYSNFHEPLILDVLGSLGYTAYSDRWGAMHEWVNDLRDDFGTDWALGFFICDDSVTGGGRSSAYVNGPCVWEWSHTSASVYHHEMGHSWGARDEYHPDAAQSPTGTWGYTNEVNANSQYNDGNGYFSGAGESISALMINNVNYPSPWTRGAWGIWDLDGDGIYECEDTIPSVTLNAPSGSDTLTFTGNADAQPLLDEKGGNNISVNLIEAVQWRMNGGPWQEASASDGAFDESSDAYTFTTPSLADGGYVFEVRARHHFGNSTTLPTRRDAVVSGSATTNNDPMPALAVTPELGSTATTFLFDATGTLDPEDGTTGLDYRWDIDDDGSWETGFLSSSSYSAGMGSSGAQTARVEVRDALGATAQRTFDYTVSASNVPPAATFTVDDGMLFASAPVIFNFDASAVTDGEDDPSALQVRWDFEDDGIWDTSYSTTKTAAHDYAFGYVAAPVQETSGWVINGPTHWGQGFVAAGSGIGSADLNLRQNDETTPGGTSTVGIRSTLSGGWLTSITVNQDDYIGASGWITFDFGDIAVTPGNTYYLVVQGTDDDMQWEQINTNPYAGGNSWYSFGGGWTDYSPYDLTFRIYDSNPTAVPLTKSMVWAVRMEVLDTDAQTSQTVRHVAANGYDTEPTLSLGSSPTSGTTATTYNLTATGADADSGTTWDGMVEYRWDVDGDGQFETEFSTMNTRGATFSRSGIFSATCEVRDRFHATAVDTVDLSVAPGLSAIQLSDRTDGSTVQTDEQTIDVALAATDYPEEVLLSEDAGFSGAAWQPYRPVVSFDLSGGVGTKTVYCKTRSGVGNESGTAQDSIDLLGAGGAPGEVDDSGGNAFLIQKTGTPDQYDLSWGDACNIGATPGQTYAVYRGDMSGTWSWNHTSADCSVAGLSTTLAEAGADVYFVVVPRTGSEEGSYGFGRPAASAPCAAQAASPDLCP